MSRVEEVYVILAVLLTLTMQKQGRPERDSNHDLTDAGAVLHQLSSQKPGASHYAGRSQAFR